MQLRRRLRNGFQANLNYTFSKSLDDDYSLGGQGPTAPVSGGSSQVAQDWTHPEAQRGLSTFDQRHVLAVQLQYTTGMGLGRHTMLSGWKGAVYKEWTGAGQHQRGQWDAAHAHRSHRSSGNRLCEYCSRKLRDHDGLHSDSRALHQYLRVRGRRPRASSAMYGAMGSPVPINSR